MSDLSRGFRKWATFNSFNRTMAKENSEDIIAATIEYLGSDATGNKVNELLPVHSIYPELDPEKCLYSIKKEEHFWLLAKDCTALGLKSSGNDIWVILMYKPVYYFYPIKYYDLLFSDIALAVLVTRLIEMTDAPIIPDEDITNKLNPTVLELLAIRLPRMNYRLYKPATEEKAILKMNRNIDQYKEVIERIWLPRKEKGLIKNFIGLNSTCCIFCSSLDNLHTVGTILCRGDFIIGLVYQTCTKCVENLEEKTLFEKIIKSTKVFDLSNLKNPNREEYFDLIIAKLNEEKISFTKEIKKNGEELHLFLENNCKLITSYRTMLDYAYILLKDGKEKLRWDSRDDHKVETGLDHFHFDPKKYNKGVEGSYLIGNFLVDFNIIWDSIKQYLN